MDKLRRVLGGEDRYNSEESSIITQFNESTTLSWSTRVKGFCICFIIGILCSFLGALALFLPRGIILFAVFYTLGNILSMTSTCFLMGPLNQVRKMFDHNRLIATCLVIIAFVLTIIAALVLHKAGLTLVLVVIQSLAMTWYSLSYIPWARDAVKNTVLGCLDV